jgi:hypothetical protein
MKNDTTTAQPKEAPKPLKIKTAKETPPRDPLPCVTLVF